tara:strand:- start:232 stop:387 length:156 start_codon:yes stop_codon:yes gene_type:complete
MALPGELNKEYGEGILIEQLDNILTQKKLDKFLSEIKKEKDNEQKITKSKN